MDEDELLYREMNEEDPWYMGDGPGEDEEDEYDDEEYYDESDPQDGYDGDAGNEDVDNGYQSQGQGCCFIIPLFLIAVVSAVRLLGMLQG